MIELVVDYQARLGEGPLWDVKSQRLYWVNILDGEIHMYEPMTDTNETIKLDSYVGCVALTERDELIAGLTDGFYLVNPKTNALTVLERTEEPSLQTRYNDGKCDPAGRFWAGTMSLVGEEKVGALYCMESDHSVRKKIDHVSISNGLAWSGDHQTMYYIDTPERCIFAYDYEIETGEISNQRRVVEIPKEEGSPDGMTIDVDGMLWVAHWGGAQVACWNPFTGEKVCSIAVPALQVTSCTFGGPDLDELYITTARNGMTEEQLKQYPQSGGVFRIKLDTKGLAADRFK